MTDLRTAAQQALEALEAFMSDELRPYEAAKTAAALRAALEEPVQEPPIWEQLAKIGNDALEAGALAEPVQEQCKGAPGECKFNGGCMYACYAAPPQEPCNKSCAPGYCYCKPVQEPFGYLWPTGRHPEFRFTQQKRDGVDGIPLYTAPPQRKED